MDWSVRAATAMTDMRSAARTLKVRVITGFGCVAQPAAPLQQNQRPGVRKSARMIPGRRPKQRPAADRQGCRGSDEAAEHDRHAGVAKPGGRQTGLCTKPEARPRSLPRYRQGGWRRRGNQAPAPERRLRRKPPHLRPAVPARRPRKPADGKAEPAPEPNPAQMHAHGPYDGPARPAQLGPAASPISPPARQASASRRSISATASGSDLEVTIHFDYKPTSFHASSTNGHRAGHRRRGTRLHVIGQTLRAGPVPFPQAFGGALTAGV